MQKLPPLRALQAFRYAARELSFKAAAEALNISQAAVSTHIRGLEDFLGLKLFVRLTREVQLTHEGRALSGYVETGFQELERGIALFAPNSDPGRLTVATVPSFASRWLVPRIDSFQKAHPEIQLSLQPNLQLVGFRGDGVDLAIRFGSGDYPGLESRLLLEEKLLPVCHSMLTGSEPVTPESLVKLPWLIDESIDMESSWRAFQEELGIEIPDSSITLRVTEGTTLVEAVLAGRGIALMRYSLVADLLKAGLLQCPINISVPAEYQYYLVAPEAKFRTDKVRAFVSWITGEVGSG
ncbi:LysR substrate-binding domain-containing protein [Marinobacter sp. 71-i]|uniref:LysR substrate-binding domain-containing protein n=1 Tax=Marinobacter iranensis TaxID=2962607 RepID=A0ABT5YGC5_9GAMM|nr:LysR substrate-binding domain-containing protein [Marinobacter iranensis]MDF0752724.1 LysR substrate-binding domain-containing protein [Marinobacter iranensis]